jgi:hypothetical protein
LSNKSFLPVLPIRCMRPGAQPMAFSTHRLETFIAQVLMDKKTHCGLGQLK